MREYVYVAVILFAVAVAWAAFIVIIDGYPLRSDEAEYDLTAARLADGLGLTDRGGGLYVHRHPPLYPVFVAGIYALGGSPATVRWAQWALALATLYLLYLTAGRAFGDDTARAALLAGGVYLPTAYYATCLLSEVLFTFFLVLGVYLLIRASARDRGYWWMCGAAGVAFGLAGLTRAVALAAALAVALVLWWRRGERGRRWVSAAAFAVGVVLAVLSWSAYVYGETGRLVLVDTKAPDVFYRGNNAGTPMHHAWDVIDGSAGYVAVPEGVRTGSAYGLSRTLGVAALKYMVTHPGQTALRVALRFADIWEVERCFLGAWRQGFLPNAPEGLIHFFVAAEVAASAAALALFWFTVTLMGKSSWRRLTLAIVFTTAAAYAITIAHSRYHYPLMVLGVPALGYFFVGVLPRLRARAYSRRRILLVCVPVAVLVLVWVRMVWLFVTRGS